MPDSLARAVVDYSGAKFHDARIVALSSFYSGQVDILRHIFFAALIAGLLYYLLGRRRSFLRAWIPFILFGVLEEVRQAVFKNPFTLDDVGDILFDGAGAALGIGIVYLALQALRARRGDTPGIRPRPTLLAAGFAFWLACGLVAAFVHPLKCNILIDTTPKRAIVLIDGDTVYHAGRLALGDSVPARTPMLAGCPCQDTIMIEAYLEGYPPARARLLTGGEGTTRVRLSFQPPPPEGKGGAEALKTVPPGATGTKENRPVP